MKFSDDDTVVAEIGLYLRVPPKNEQLHLLQYPLRHALSTIGSERKITQVKLRPRHARLELNLSLYPESEHYSHTKSFNQDVPVERQIGHTQTLTSQPHLHTPQSNYTAGSYIPNSDKGPAFFVLPVRAIQQLRPTFQHIDENERTNLLARAEKKGLLATSTADTPSEVAPLQLSFRRRETERAAERRKNSYATLRQKERSEQWLNLRFADASCDHVKEKKINLFTTHQLVDQKEAAFVRGTTYTDVFRNHTIHSRTGFVAKAITDRDHVSLTELRASTTDAAVSYALAQARIVRFAQLSNIIGEHRSHPEILAVIRKKAFCVRGLWVARKPRKDVGKKSAAERYDACRTLLLDLFRRANHVKTCEALEMLGDPLLISFESVLSILQEVGVRQPGTGWKLKLVPDDDFVRQHGELCRELDDDWERRIEAARDTLRKCLKRKR